MISMIDFNSLVLESWDVAGVAGRSSGSCSSSSSTSPVGRKRRSPFQGIVYWEPDASTEGFIRADWERVRTKIRHGLADELSESDGRILGPCTKATDSRVLRSQPFSKVRAKSRAFALKPSFTLDLYNRIVRAQPDESLVMNQIASPAANFEGQLLERFRRFEDRTVGEVALELGVPSSSAKNFAAGVLRRALIRRTSSPASVSSTRWVSRLG